MEICKPVLILMVGLPRSGKSTWAQGRRNCPIVNPDSIRLSLHGQVFAAKAEPMVWLLAHLMVESLFLAGHSTVILDATNTTNKRRQEWENPAWNISHIVIDTPKEECIRRAIEDGRPELVPIIEKMAAQFEPILK